MRTRPTPRGLVAVALCTVLGWASPAAAQALAPRVGEGVPYRIELPATAQVSTNGASLQARSGNFVVVVAVGYVTEFAFARSLGDVGRGDDPEARRALTNTVVSSDSLLLEMVAESLSGVELVDATKEVRMLGGERAGYLRGRVRCNCPHPLLVQAYATGKDGIVYALTLGGGGENAESHEPLMARIHQSFVLPDAPPAVDVPALRTSP